MKKLNEKQTDEQVPNYTNKTGNRSTKQIEIGIRQENK